MTIPASFKTAITTAKGKPRSGRNDEVSEANGCHGVLLEVSSPLYASIGQPRAVPRSLRVPSQTNLSTKYPIGHDFQKNIINGEESTGKGR